MDHKVTTDYTRLLDNANVKVYVRARPCANGEQAPEDMFERRKESPTNIVIKDTERMQYGNHAFSFDNICWTDTSQATLFDLTSKSLVDHALKGINSCCFAYGQTGSGKTFSIFGEAGEKAGLLPRSISYMFDMVKRGDSRSTEVTFVVSFLEIYCDRVRDLSRAYLKKTGRPFSHQTSSTAEWFLRQQLRRTESTSSFGSNPARSEEDYDYEKANFEIHEDAQGSVFVKDLALVTVTCREDVDAIVQSGLKLRATHETKMNAVSSRSHTVFTVHIFQQNRKTEEVIYGSLHLVDLAGSERLKKSESDGQRLKEALHINSSLSAVGKVIMSLDPGSGYNYIPYRDSKLTRILQNSIGGNSLTTLIATIHPMKEHYEECLSTLQFANRCRSVQNQPRVNYISGSGTDKDRRIRRLQEEVNNLKRQMESLRKDYNQRFISALNELGFEAEEVTENGEIKFADGMVLQSVFEDVDGSSDNQGRPSPVGVRSRRELMMGQNVIHKIDFSQRDREQLRLKYANAKTNLAMLSTDARKDKEEARKTIAEQRKRLVALEDTLYQRDREHKRALTAQSEKHRIELQQLMSHSNQQSTVERDHSTSSNRPQESRASIRTKDIHDQQLRTRIAAVEASKEEEIALIRQHYESMLELKANQLVQADDKLKETRAQITTSMQHLRADCEELCEFTGKLYRMLCNGERIISLPKNLLAEGHKLRQLKALIATYHRVVDGRTVNVESDSRKNNRPVSAPVHRCRPQNYVSTLRTQTNQSSVDSDPPAIPHQATSVGNAQSSTTEAWTDENEVERLRGMLTAERKKSRALRTANISLMKQVERKRMNMKK